MTYKDNAVKDLRIAYIGGGSRGWAWTFMRDLALEPELGGTIVLYDIDKEAAKANEIIGNGISERPEAVGKWKYIVADTLAEALTGSDFVVISILPGTFDEMESDVHEPEKYGIYQSVGDTAGPGGMVPLSEADVSVLSVVFVISPVVKVYFNVRYRPSAKSIDVYSTCGFVTIQMLS